MESLLFLAHRLPYPPNKGDKVRSCHFFKHLASRYRVFLGTFIDDPADWQHLDAVRRLCADAHIEGIAPRWRRARSATALLRGEPLTLAYFRSRALQQWVRRIVQQERVREALAFSSPMAQYVLDLPQLRSIVDFVDMDSAKWSEYAARRGWPARALYQREARRLLAYERAVAARAQASIFVTEEETRRFVAEAPQCAARVVTIRNGVDSDYFSPARELENPFERGERPIVFTGAMDYWPNVDAVVWFAREVLPLLRQRDPAVRFYVVGMNPDGAVRALASGAATVVTGRVPDVRPYLRHARVVVAPLRVARGLQNKVLEAMAMAKPVVTTPACAAAIAARAGKELAIASDAGTFASQVLALMDPAPAGQMGRFARERILASYAWPASFARLDELLEAPRPAAARAVAG
ncbi:MAG TPA: TIGR03087 family PEP-CTERM/XrtA system glycosyltransferase [Burkholderiales bacterium]|nr:TIGR03087 family PEP-CTERM/XrtA system glycosyltransferase [Burkholderiales bacterium]